MQPIYLSLQGIFSYQEKQEIDFTKLTSAGLFGIFGATGSGKSTILEAIVFSLYGDYERMNQKGDDRFYNMMNLRSNEMFVDYRFLLEDVQYRFTVYARRNKNNFNDISKNERIAYKLHNNDWVPLDSVNAEELLGISYSNFKRTVIIPQGRFMEFIQLSSTERVRMIKELFNLNKYELYNQTVALEKKCDEQINIRTGKIEQLGEVSLDDVNEKKKHYKEQEKLLNNTKNKIVAVEKQKDILETLKDKSEKLTGYIEKKKQLDNQKNTIVEKEALVKKYEYCRLHFKERLTQEKKLSLRMQQLQQVCTGLKNKLEITTGELDRSLKKYRVVELEVQKHPESELKLRDYKIHLDIRTKQSMLINEEKRIPAAEAFIKEQQEQAKLLKIALDSIVQQQSNFQKKIAEIADLSMYKSKFATLQYIRKSIEDAKKEVLAYDKEIHVVKKEIDHIFNKLSISKKFDTISDVENEVHNLLLVADSKGKEIQKEIQNLQVKAELTGIAKSLDDGKPCPVCGSVHHPDKIKGDDVENAIVLHQQQYSENEEYIKTLREGLIHAKSAFQQQETIRKAERKVSAKMHEDTIARNNLMAEVDHINEKELESQLSNLEQYKAKLKDFNIQIKEHNEKLEKQKQLEDKAKLKLQDIQAEVIKLKSNLETLESQIQYIGSKDVDGFNTEQLQQIAMNLHKKIEDEKEQYVNLKSALDNLQKQEAELKGNYTSELKQLDAVSNEYDHLKKELDELLASSEYTSVDDIYEILDQEPHIESIKKELQEYAKTLHHLVQVIEELQKDLGERVFNQEEYNTVMKQYTEIKTYYDDIQKSAITLQQEILQLDKALESRKVILNELKTLQNRKDNIVTLKSMFKASGFVQYVSTVYLQNLCTAANERFMRLTKQSLSLELDDENNFLVRDFLNNGRTRSIKTLSGGQAFQAALSLALALSDSIYHGGRRAHDFFFIDEGFGSQDKDALRIVFETLRSLQKEGKTVGVISHVEDLKEEIATNISVVKDAERGSLVG